MIECRFNASRILTALLGCIGGLALAADAADAAPGRYADAVKPVLAKYCFECHGAEKQKGDLRMDTLDPDLLKGEDAETWHDALNQLNLGEMPPPKSPQPSVAERRVMVDWMTKSLREAARAKRFADGRVLMRRLTRYEYQNTMRDLLGVDLDFAKELPPEPASPEGFLNNAATLEMSPMQIETYLNVARKALAVAIVEGARPEAIRVSQTNTTRGQLPNKPVAGLPPAHPEFALDLKEFPRSGAFRVRVTAKAAIPKAAGFPRIQISLGHVPGIIHVPRKEIGEIELSSQSSRTYEFVARMEDFPQPGPVAFGRSGFKGMIVLLDYEDADGKELRYPDRRYVQIPPKPKKGAKPKPLPKAPAFGSRLEIAVESVEFEGPYHPTWPPASHRRLMGERAEGLSESAYARARLKGFMRRAFRRPVKVGEVETYGKMFDRIRPGVETLEAAMREVFAAVLVSPHFLYVVEVRHQTGAAQRLGDHELATRLAYFLWSTMPDGRLMKLADEGRLSRPAVLQKEVKRMLEDRRSHEFARRFADQWFDLGALDRVAVNPEFYPKFDNALKEDMRRETYGFFNQTLRRDLSALELLDSDWSLMNRALARHYGITPLPRSRRFERVTLKPEDRRGGVLGHASFLLGQSGGERGHPIKRAVWILDRLLDAPPAPPPPDVPELDAESPSLAGLTVKEQLALHRERESCANCHRGIDPWGIPLEHYDAVGLWRENTPVRIGKKGAKPAKPVANDAATELPDGTTIRGVDDLKRFLKEERKEWFARSLVKRLMSYALGRSLDLGDQPAVEALTKKFVQDDFRVGQLIVELVTSETFRSK